MVEASAATGAETRGKVPGQDTDPGISRVPDPAPRTPRRFVSTTVEVEGRAETKIVELPAFEPPAWDESAELAIVGARVRRADALEKVTGQARYTTDVSVPGMLYAALLRAPMASGRVTTLDVEPALALPGVRGALVLDEVARRENITVSDAEVDAEVERYAERSGRSAAAVRARLEKEGSLSRLYAGLRREKTVDFLLSRARKI
jgi:hypothetical protein